MEQVAARATARDRFHTILLAVFAVMAMVLASIGLYRLIAYSLEQRTRGFGIRLALGAGPSHLRNLIVGQAMTFAVTGILLGLAAAFAITRLIAGMLYGVKAADPVVFICSVLSMLLVAFVASLLPARRSGRVDPTVALRHE